MHGSVGKNDSLSATARAGAILPRLAPRRCAAAGRQLCGAKHRANRAQSRRRRAPGPVVRLSDVADRRTQEFGLARSELFSAPPRCLETSANSPRGAILNALRRCACAAERAGNPARDGNSPVGVRVTREQVLAAIIARCARTDRPRLTTLTGRISFSPRPRGRRKFSVLN